MKKILKCLLFVSVLGMAVACGTKHNEPKPSSDDSHEPTQEELDDGRELIENELYTDSGFRIEFDAVGAKIKKMYYESLQIAKDGFVAGRCANRIAGASFELNGETYNVDKNDGNNSLHGGTQGFGTRTWTKVEQHPSSITYSYHSADGEMGYPGNLDITVKYTLLNNGQLILEYSAEVMLTQSSTQPIIFGYH